MQYITSEQHRLHTYLRKPFLGQPRITYKRGSPLFSPGDNLDRAMYIENGYVKMYDITHAGQINILILFKPGDIIPLAGLIDGKGVHSFYQALGEVVVRALPAHVFKEKMMVDGDFNYAVMRHAVSYIRDYSTTVKNLQFRTARERMIARIVFMARRCGRTMRDSIIIEIPVSQQDIADTLNMTRETASRELLRLESQGHISLHYHQITVTNLERLAAEIE